MLPSDRTMLAILLGVVALVWAPSLWNGFASDDLDLVLGRTYRLGDIAGFFRTDLWGPAAPSGYYRPLMSLSLALDEAMWGKSALGAHLHSLAWHLVAVGALVVWARALVGSLPALVAGTIFGLHAVQSEAICFVSSRNDPMAAALGLLGLLVLRQAGIVRAGAAVLLFVAAALTKESALAFGVLVVGLAVTEKRGLFRAGLVSSLVAAGWAAVRFGLGPPALDPVPPGNWSRLTAQAGPVAHVYLQKLFLPWPLSDGETVIYAARPAGLTLLLVVGSLLFLAVLVARGGRLALLGVVFGAVSFLPSAIALAARFLLAERYLYLPMIGLAVAVAASVPKEPRTLRALVPLAVLWIACAEVRIPEWRNDLRLSLSAVEDVGSPYSFGWLGRSLVRVGQPAAALPWFEKALAGSPPYCSVAPDAVLAARGVEGEGARLGALAWQAGCAGEPGFREAWALALSEATAL